MTTATVLVPAAPVTRRGSMTASRWLAPGLIWLAQFAVALGNAGLAVLGPFFVSDLGVNHAQLGLLTTALYAGSALMLIPAGHVSDHVAPRTMFLLMVLVAAAPLLGFAAVLSYQSLLILVLVYGLANGGIKPPAVRAITDWFPPRRRGLPMGINSTALAAAGLACGLMVPAIVASLNWHAVLPAIGCTTVLAGRFAWVVYRDRPAARVGSTVPQPGPRLVTLLRRPGLLLLCAVTLLQAGVQCGGCLAPGRRCHADSAQPAPRAPPARGQQPSGALAAARRTSVSPAPASPHPRGASVPSCTQLVAPSKTAFKSACTLRLAGSAFRA